MRVVFVILALLAPRQGLAWDGTNSGNGNAVQIERGQTVRQGREVEFYDYGAGTYRTFDVDSVRQSGGGVEVEGTDSSGNAVTLEMDGNGE